MRHEVFGPVVCVSPFDALDEAIGRANALPYAFQAAVFTRDLDTALRAARRLDASAVMVNDHTAFRVDWMPFAGLRQSGLGVGGIPHTMAEMQVEEDDCRAVERTVDDHRIHSFGFARAWHISPIDWQNRRQGHWAAHC